MERGAPALIDCRGAAGPGQGRRALARALARGETLRRHPGLRLGLVGGGLHRFGSGFTWLHLLPESWVRAREGDLDREAFRMRLFATPYAFYGGAGGFFGGTVVEEKLRATRAFRHAPAAPSVLEDVRLSI